jgi:transcriptional regulator with XRE-family HTH domain
MPTVGQKIREMRVAKRYTQEQMEIKTGIKREYLSKIETGGLPNITIKTLKKITDALGVSLSKFFREANC